MQVVGRQSQERVRQCPGVVRVGGAPPAGTDRAYGGGSTLLGLASETGG